MIPGKRLGPDQRAKKSTAKKCLVCSGNVRCSNSHQDFSDTLFAAVSSVPEKDDVTVLDSGAHARLYAALNTLKEQNAALAKAVSSISFTDAQSSSLSSSFVLPPRVDEGEEPPHTESPTSTSISLFRSKSKRTSISTSTSDSLWFDAPEFDDGPEEFLLESAGADDHGPDSRIIDYNDREDANSGDTDIEGDETPKREPIELPPDPSQVIRRAQLPSLPPADEGSLFAVLKKNVGKVRYADL
jgi:oxysterol-binding protein-related protein 3/6/7